MELVDEATKWKYLGGGGSKTPLPILLVAFRLSEVKEIQKFYPRMRVTDEHQLLCRFTSMGFDGEHVTLQQSQEKFLAAEQVAIAERVAG